MADESRAKPSAAPPSDIFDAGQALFEHTAKSIEILERAMQGAPQERRDPLTRECEGCGQRKPIEEMAVCFLPGTGESYQCEQCRGMP